MTVPAAAVPDPTVPAPTVPALPQVPPFADPPFAEPPAPIVPAARAVLPLVAAVAAADLLLYGHDVGLGFAAFCVVLTVLAGLAARPTRGEWAKALAVTAAALMPLLQQSNALTVLVAVAGTFHACLTVQNLLPAAWGARVAEVLVQAALAPSRLFPIVRAGLRLENPSSPGPALLRWALPGALALVFVALFADANPLIARAVEAVDLLAALGALFSERTVFWLLMALFAAPFIRAGAPWAGRLGAGLAMMAVLRPVGSDAARLAASTREGAFAARALLLFNAVFVAQTASDLVYLWGGLALPEGMSYAEYAHRGAYSLLGTAILAAIFVVWATRPRGPAEGSPLVARLVLLWVAQNLVLLASSALRLDLYVEAYALTHWRVAAFAWMGLVAAGFVLIVARALLGRSLGWLVGANAAVLVATLYAVAFVDWTDAIARHNLARADTRPVDHAYLRWLGPTALPAVVAHRRAVGPGAYDCEMGTTEAILRRRVDATFDRREWTRRRARIAAVAAVPKVPHIRSCGSQGRRRPTSQPAAQPALRGE